MQKLRLTALLFLFVSAALQMHSQATFPVNDVANPKEGSYAFINATIIKDAQNTLTGATLVIRQGKIENVGVGVSIPKDAVVIDCKGKFIYPAFIDLFSDYGITLPQSQQTGGGRGFFGAQQITSVTKGAFGWNQAIKSETEGAKLFSSDDAKAKALRDIGFGAVLTHQKDGLARGTGPVVSLATQPDNFVMLKEKAAAFYSLNKGTSTQSYPGSMMGYIALLRQTYLDAQWYKSNPAKEGTNLSLKSWNDNQALPQIFDAGDKWNDLRADKIGDEFGIQYIIKGGGNEYQRIKDIAATKAAYILTLNYPAAMDVDDANDLRFVGLDDLKHWELAPGNAAALEKAGVSFCLSTADLATPSEFMANLRKAIEYGLTETKALEALTKTPAALIGMSEKLGSIENGKIANFIITSGPVFAEKTVVLQNWTQGIKNVVKEDGWYDVKGSYKLTASNTKSFTVDVKDGGVASFISKDTLTGKYTYDGKLVKLSYTEGRGPNAKETIFSGAANGDTWNGTGRDAAGNSFTWTAAYDHAAEVKSDSVKAKQPAVTGKVTYPFVSFGWEDAPATQTILIKNATVWTSDAAGKLEATDILVKNGKIAAIGKNLPLPTDSSARVIDATGKHVTAGIIDEHSHIAAASINEGGQSVTSEVRIGDNLNPDDINIYRQLSGGVTTSHILHGSANTIGGQTQLIKLRWGANAEEMKFAGADPFIKFALGENVKRSSSAQGNQRFPDTRMGVEQVLTDAFQRASDYQKMWKAAEENNKKKGAVPIVVRRDLELDALVEIMNKKRFITCHSYVQSEITATMRVADKFGFPVNTFTHILEGYKVADKMKAHGANASTFSDWWNYKMEVLDAIPYNAYLMKQVGLNVAINSDDAEMARRLNQEAAKSVKYGGMSEEDALKMVTINPAKMLHVDNKVGSIAIGKDADLVVWNNNPLSIYAVAQQTIVDGIVYFDREKDAALRVRNQAEKARLIAKLAAAKRSSAAPGGAPGNFQRARPRFEVINSCMDHNHQLSLLAVDAEDLEGNN
ncbi:MAG: amidohydrolase family protein [Ferruginibacter sp.]